MKTRNQIIYDMCMTYRQDFGILKLPGAPADIPGMTVIEQKQLFDKMAEIFDKCISPHVEIKR